MTRPDPASRRGLQACVHRDLAYINERLQSEATLQTELEFLRGKQLGCWCAPETCHGDILAELANALGD